jgi:DNA-directed RNA polymerase subunit F|tara:strand:+ start:147 stop:524 length:378 start_codon:yes stop_codon:yes gene_type:complete
MIDTDKYEGHDTGWRAHFFEDGSIAIGGVCKLLTEETGHKTRKMIEANALLIADAPLLLQEVKRLREEVYNLTRANDTAWALSEVSEEEVKRLREEIDNIANEMEQVVRTEYEQEIIEDLRKVIE